MSMSDQPDPVKQNILDWCKEDHMKCEDVSDKNPQFAFCIQIGTQIVIYKKPKLLDRIFVQSQITVNPKHTKLIKSKPDLEKKLMIGLPTLATQFDVSISFDATKDNELTGIRIYKTHFHSSISKADFLALITRHQPVYNVILNQLRQELGFESQQAEAQQKFSDSDNPLAG